MYIYIYVIYSIVLQGAKAYGFLDTEVLFQVNIADTPTNGFAGYGTTSFGLSDFDNLNIQSSAGLRIIDQLPKQLNTNQFIKL